jgi:plastocyanin
MKFRALVAVPLIAISLVGCGSSGGSNGNNSATIPANATVITAIDGIAWDAKSYTATAVDGKVTIAAKNDSTLPHNLHLVDAESVDVGLSLTVTNRGDVETKSIALAPGSYQVICTIAGHGNMKATLTVK